MFFIALQPCQKLDIILENKVVQKLKLPKNDVNKKCATKPIFQKIRHRKLTLKVRFWLFLIRSKCYAKHPKVPIIGEDG